MTQIITKAEHKQAIDAAAKALYKRFDISATPWEHQADDAKAPYLEEAKLAVKGYQKAVRKVLKAR